MNEKDTTMTMTLIDWTAEKRPPSKATPLARSRYRAEGRLNVLTRGLDPDNHSADVDEYVEQCVKRDYPEPG